MRHRLSFLLSKFTKRWQEQKAAVTSAEPMTSSSSAKNTETISSSSNVFTVASKPLSTAEARTTSATSTTILLRKIQEPTVKVTSRNALLESSTFPTSNTKVKFSLKTVKWQEASQSAARFVKRRRKTSQPPRLNTLPFSKKRKTT